jgi:hypothetical protein
MSVEENIVLVRRWFKEAWNEGRVETIYELMHENGACHGSAVRSRIFRSRSNKRSARTTRSPSAGPR